MNLQTRYDLEMKKDRLVAEVKELGAVGVVDDVVPEAVGDQLSSQDSE